MDYVCLFITLALLVAGRILFTTHFRRNSGNLPHHLPHTSHHRPPLPIKEPSPQNTAAISAKHGPILLLRFGSRRVLLVTSPNAAEECFTKNDILIVNRPRLLAGKIFGSNYSNLGWSPYGDHWRNLRRISTLEMLSSHRLNEFHDIRTDEGRLMIRKIISVGSSPVNPTLMLMR
ncbi:hypothetical protein R6Q57_000707 [Mikania cordata]